MDSLVIYYTGKNVQCGCDVISLLRNNNQPEYIIYTTYWNTIPTCTAMVLARAGWESAEILD